ncbi:MAG: barstar family protein [Lachnospiraceae bacterium]|nr:barstar family protein [Lachnospiraceae bacterium]
MNKRQKKKRAKQEEIRKAIEAVIAEKKPEKKVEKKPEPKAKAAGNKVVFDLSKMEKKQQLHEAFHAEKAFPDYEGNSLDALAEMLSGVSTPVELEVKHLADWEAAAESYRNNIKKLLEKAQKENENLTIVLS